MLEFLSYTLPPAAVVLLTIAVFRIRRNAREEHTAVEELHFPTDDEDELPEAEKDSVRWRRSYAG